MSDFRNIVFVASLPAFLACGSNSLSPESDAGTTPEASLPESSLPDVVTRGDAGGDSASPTIDASSGDAAAGDAQVPVACTSCGNCPGQSGDFHAQTFQSGGETRYYYLHVPPAPVYSCAAAAPLLVDFHGTAEGSVTDLVEEDYALDAMNAVADQLGFIVVRPRSRPAPTSMAGDNIFQWDGNGPSDIPRNIAFADGLVSYLESQYRIDPTRVYASGFSNGTNMAVQFLGDPKTPFHGYAVVEGGLFTYDGSPSHAAFDASAPRIYATTGYRDYIYVSTTALFDYLSGLSYPAGSLWNRQTDSGHELYGWDYTELFQWLDRGMKPGPSGTLTGGWSRDASFTSNDGITKLVAVPGGAVLATGTGGDFWQRSAAGAWTQTAHVGGSIPVFTDMCLQPSGTGMAVGQAGLVALTTDFGATWTAAPSVPEYDNEGFGFSFLTTVACNANLIVGAGFWADAYSLNGGSSWNPGSMVGSYGYAAQAATVAVSAAGTWIAGGYYDYIGRSTDGQTYTPVTPASATAQWYTGIDSQPGGLFWIVGEQGTIYQSADDGLTWTPQTSPVIDDLYGVAFQSPTLGMAVGRAGLALLTKDGGATWQDVSTGLNVFLAGVTWLNSTTALVGGEGGTMLTYTVM